MAHFAEIDENDIVLRIIVVSNDEILDEEGVETESIGQQFCTDLLGGTWVQCSYNSNIRGRYARIGDTYDSDLDLFILPKPFPSWSLAEDTGGWEPPTPYIVGYIWDEDTLSWVKPDAPFASWEWNDLRWIAPVDYPDDGLAYNWDEDSLSWVEVE